MSRVMCSPEPFQRLFILPGGMAFSSEKGVLRTLLGSCVSVVVWHPRRRMGGMCHYLLADRPRVAPDCPPDGRYATDALALFVQRMQQADTDPAQYVAGIYGGANVVDVENAPDIGRRNIAAAEAWCQQQGLQVLEREVGGRCHRVIEFDIAEGHVRVRDGLPAHAATQEIPS
jgi:chemotaxis protein CheD